MVCLAGALLTLTSAHAAKGTKAKKENKKAVYIMGVSASFTDSLVYFTDVQLLDSIQLGKKELLPERQHYSQQLKDYLEQKQGLENRTCFVYYGNNEAKLKKESAQLKAKYQKNNQRLLIRQVNPNEFYFTKPDDE
jgi:hypothetical protein